MFIEADVNTATPSLSNAAATWAGWAVTAVTAKFYRSQSDTPKSSNAHNTSRILLNKPASLGSYRSSLLASSYCVPIFPIFSYSSYISTLNFH